MRSLASALTGIFVTLCFVDEVYAQLVIDFNDPASLAALSYKDRRGTVVKAARFTFVGGITLPDVYVEDNMTFLNGVIPPDPALGPIPQPDYHLVYENPRINNDLILMANLPDPENQPRLLASHLKGSVIQLMYDPNNDGIPDPFNLIRLDVLSGNLNVGVKSLTFGIAVYNNLTPGFTWFLDNATNLTRATLEQFGDRPFVVDNIVFAPVGPVAAGSPSTGPLNDREDLPPPFIDLPPLSLHLTRFAPAPKIDVKPGKEVNVIKRQSEGLLPVAIITTRGLDAATVDARSVELGPNGARPVGRRLTDVDGDGNLDLMLHFQIPDIGIQCGDIFLTVKGQTFDGQTFLGSDFIHTITCRDEAAPE